MTTKVFIVGAGGYIGQSVSLAFRRAGYKVTGLIRHKERGHNLLLNEVQTILGDYHKPDEYKEYLRQADIIIDCVGDNTSTFIDKVAEASKGKYLKPLFIFTSGHYAHGDVPHIVDETHFPDKSTLPIPLRARIDFEQLVVNHKDVRGVVVRPGYTYGGDGGVMENLYFNIGENDDLVLYGRLDKRVNWVHIEDLADAYVRIAKAGRRVDGEIFDITEKLAPTYQESALAAAKAAGWKGKVVHITVVPEDNVWLVISECNCVTTPQKAYDLLGWRDNHLGFIEEIDIYYQCWKLAETSKKRKIRPNI